ncbi:MAG: dUTP diphosphatase [Candidatus Falkowbacteria bacterium]
MQNNSSQTIESVKQRGKFIVLYGINNLGKSTQTKLLVEKLQSKGITTEYLKYPLYDLIPSGTLLNDYLRRGNFYKLSAREAQIIYTLNRAQYQIELEKKLADGITIVAEDYTGTGLAWGIGAGVDEQFLKYVNGHLLTEDIAILLDGERFTEAIEQQHAHEKNDNLTQRVREVHLRLGQEKNWHLINANLTIDEVHQAIWKKVNSVIQKRPTVTATEDFEDLIHQEYPMPFSHMEMEIINQTPDQTTHFLNYDGIAPSKITIPHHDSAVLKIKKTDSEAKLLTRAHVNDAGLDIYANDYYTLHENERAIISTGIQMAIPKGCVGLVWDKSGIAASGLHTMGGVIDSGYRGELKILVVNLSQDIYNIQKGQKIAQLLIQKIKTPDPIESDVLDETERSDMGFGSSGGF